MSNYPAGASERLQKTLTYKSQLGLAGGDGNRLGIDCVILPTFDERPDILRRDELYLVTELRHLARPITGAAAASNTTIPAGCSDMNCRNRPRINFLRHFTCPATNAPWTWKTRPVHSDYRILHPAVLFALWLAQPRPWHSALPSGEGGNHPISGDGGAKFFPCLSRSWKASASSHAPPSRSGGKPSFGGWWPMPFSPLYFGQSRGYSMAVCEHRLDGTGAASRASGKEAEQSDECRECALLARGYVRPRQEIRSRYGSGRGPCVVASCLLGRRGHVWVENRCRGQTLDEFLA